MNVPKAEDPREVWLRRASIALAVLTGLVAVLFIFQALHIYFTGVSDANQPSPGVYLEQIYSVKTIGEHFAPIAPVVYVWLAGCLAMLAARAIFPAKKEKPDAAIMKAWREEALKKGPKKAIPERLIAYIGLVIAVMLVIVGIFNGSLRDVFIKAVNICTECVGLG